MPKNTCHHHNPAPLWASQNFLTSHAEIQRLISLTTLAPSDHVLEIGPGKGHITRHLLSVCAKVTAIELDPSLCAKLRQRFQSEPALSLRQGDFLKSPLPQSPSKVFANNPFSQTAPIIRRLTQSPNPPSAAWLIVEWGAAKRFSGPSTSGWSLKPYFEVRLAAKIKREQFHPSPKVDAALLELKRKDDPDLPWNQQRDFLSFLERARKDGIHRLLTGRQISTALRLAGLPRDVRDGNMEYVQWLCLFRCWQRFQNR